jgi:hypothetical protein
MLKLKLVKVGKHKIQVVKLIRMFTELGLKESKELMDNAPSILLSKQKDIDIEQIIKNFAAIGAMVEKIKEKPVEEPKESTVGVDTSYSPSQRPGMAKQKKKDYRKKETITHQKNKPEIQFKTKQKLKLKPAITFAVVIAIIKSFISIRFGFMASFYAIFFVAVGIAYFLRKYNINTDKRIGIAAFAITFLYFFANVIADAIILYLLYQYVIPLNIFALLASLLTTRNFLVIIAAGVAYFFAINKDVFKKFRPKTEETEIDDNNSMENKQIKNQKEKKRF